MADPGYITTVNGEEFFVGGPVGYRTLSREDADYLIGKTWRAHKKNKTIALPLIDFNSGVPVDDIEKVTHVSAGGLASMGLKAG